MSLKADLAADELRRVEAEVQRRTWALDPVAWCEQKLGDTLWSGQRRILHSVRDHRRTAVPTAHEMGKSFTAGRVAGWWIDIHAPGEAFVVTTAPTAPQVKVILWKEIGRAHTQGRLKGRVNQTEWLLDVNGKEEIVAFGRKPSDYSPAAFQGIHAPYVLVIVDEANGVSGLWEAIDSVIANDQSKILAIGNPDIPSGEFYNACKPGSGYNVIEIGAFDSPNFTGEPLPKPVLAQLMGPTYVEEKRRKWAPRWVWTKDGKKCVPPPGAKAEDTNPFWQSKVLGKFPLVQGDNSLIPLLWIRAAQDRYALRQADGNMRPRGAHALGQDVGGGGDASTLAESIGPMVTIIHEDHNPDTMATCGNLISQLKRTGAPVARVDVVGIGRGLVDRAREIIDEEQYEFNVIGINVGEKPINEEDFENLRAENYWNLRTEFEEGIIEIDPLDDDLAAELSSIKFERVSKGRIKIESKKDAKARGVPSPNRADAVMLARSKGGHITDTTSMMTQSVNPAPSYRIPEPTTAVSFTDMHKMFGR